MSKIERMLRGVTRVEIIDYNQHCSYKNGDGGCYYHAVVYKKRKNRKWEVYHYSSSYFPYCSIYGIYMSCSDCNNRCEPVFLTKKELIRAIENALQDPLCEINVYYPDGTFKNLKYPITICGACYPRVIEEPEFQCSYDY